MQREKKTKEKNNKVLIVYFILAALIFMAGNVIHLEEKSILQTSVFALAQTDQSTTNNSDNGLVMKDLLKETNADSVPVQTELNFSDKENLQLNEEQTADKIPLRRESKIVKEKNTTIEVYYPVTGNDRIDQDILAVANGIIRRFEEATKEYSGNMELVADYTFFVTEDNRFSCVFRIQQKAGGLNLVETSVETRLYRLDTGRRLYLEDVFTDDYLSEVSKYIRSNFRQTEKFDSIINEPSFTNYTEPVIENFQTFALDNQKISFYFPKGALLKGSYDLVTVEMSLDRLKEVLKDPASDLFEPLTEAMPIEEEPKQADDEEITDNTIDPTKPMVALTFDDGPHETRTTKILDALEANNAKATFFVLGNRVGRNPDVLRRAVSLGCEIGNHTYGHLQLTKLSLEDIRFQVNETNRLVEEITGQPPTLLRPPYGAFNETVKQTVNMPMILWCIDTLDWKTKSRDKTVSTVIDNIQDGDIVLMHDIHETSAEAAEIIIPELIKQGYQLVTVSELAEYRGIDLQNGNTYRRFLP